MGITNMLFSVFILPAYMFQTSYQPKNLKTYLPIQVLLNRTALIYIKKPPHFFQVIFIILHHFDENPSCKEKNHSVTVISQQKRHPHIYWYGIY